MPNHVTHRCVVKGPVERLIEFKERHFRADPDTSAGDRATFDFNTIIPMPEILRNTESGSDVEFGLFAIGHRGLSQFSTSPLTYPWVKEMGITTREQFKAYLEKDSPEAIPKALKAIQCIKETGHGSWYEWSLANWRTKWNAYSFSIERDEPELLEFKFDTAWSYPEPIFDRINELWPDLTWVIRSFDEGWNFGIRATIKDGVHTVSSTDANAALYEEVYGEPPDNSEDE